MPDDLLLFLTWNLGRHNFKNILSNKKSNGNPWIGTLIQSPSLYRETGKVQVYKSWLACSRHIFPMSKDYLWTT